MLTENFLISSERLEEIQWKFHKNQGSALFLEDTFFEKPQLGVGAQIDPPPSAVLGLTLHLMFKFSFLQFLFIVFFGR